MTPTKIWLAGSVTRPTTNESLLAKDFIGRVTLWPPELSAKAAHAALGVIFIGVIKV